jgi:polynucleotide 5'-hydroxyl-kinase GRC3/NOL9
MILTHRSARLSAFAAARAKAATSQIASDESSETGVTTPPIVAGGSTTNGSGNPQLSTLLSSFPLTKAQELDSHVSSDDEQDDTDFEGNYSRNYNRTSSYKADQPCKLSNLPPDAQCVISDTPEMLTLKLEAGETATFIGEYDLRVNSGYVMVYGAVLRSGPKKNRVYAPTTHALPVVTARGGPAEIDVISTARSLGILSKISPLWTKLWYAQSPKDTQHVEPESRSFALLRSSSDDPLKRAVTALEVEQDCQVTLNRVLSKPTATHPSSVIMVSGPKGSGKSTICKWIINTFLTASKGTASTSCFWLDLDPGQPEYSAPGLMSLVQVRSPVLGPNYTHPSGHVSSAHRTIRSHTVTSNSPREDVVHFLACAMDLRDEYFRALEDFPGAPLILNCSGWILGSAVSAMMELVQQFPLTDVVLMEPMERDTVASIEATLPMAKVLMIPPRYKPAQSRTSAELRAMQAMSYFHSLSPGKGLSLWTSDTLSHIHPWHVSYNGPNAGISNIMSYGEAVSPDFLASILDGMIVAICEIESDEAYATVQYRPPHAPSASAAEMGETMTERIGRTPEGLPYLRADNSGLIQPLDPRFSCCKGLAIVRGINVAKQELQLITPMSVKQIKALQGSKTVLVRGKFDMPGWLFLEDTYSGEAQKAKKQEAFSLLKNKTSGPYVAQRDANETGLGLGEKEWRVRHLPRNFGNRNAA